MYKSLVSAITLATFLSTSASSLANTNVDIQQLAQQGIDNQFSDADILVAKLDDIKAGTLNYYAQNMAWPVNLSDIVTNGFYVGSFVSPFGTNITGTDNGNTYALAVTVNSDTIAAYTAAELNAAAVDSDVTMTLPLPSQAAANASTLSRIYDASGVLNTMQTDILMGNNDLRNVDEIFAKSITTTSINATAGVYDNGARVYSPVNKPSASDIGAVPDTRTINGHVLNSDIALDASDVGAVPDTRTINGHALSSDLSLLPSDLGIELSNSYTLNDATKYASAKAVRDAYTQLNTNKLDTTGKASDTDLFDGLDSTFYVTVSRTINGKALNNNISLTAADVGAANASHNHDGVYVKATDANTFTQTQTFSGDVNAVFTSNSQYAFTDFLDGNGLRRATFYTNRDIVSPTAVALSIRTGDGSIAPFRYSGFVADGNWRNAGVDPVSPNDLTRKSWVEANFTPQTTTVNGQALSSNITLSATDVGAVPTTRTINGKALSSNVNLSATDIGITKSDSYTLNDSNTYASSKAVRDAFNYLNTNKLHVSSKAADSDKLDGLDSTSYLKSNNTSTGNYSTSGYLQAGRASGGVALTHNDGYGNANITFNHVSGVPEQNGNAARVAFNADSSSGANLSFQLGSGVTGGVATGLTEVLNLSASNITYKGNKIFHAGNDGAGSGLNADTLDGIDSTAFVRTTRTINGKALTGNINLSAADVGAVPTSRTVNGKALSSNITLNQADIGLGNLSRTSGERLRISTSYGTTDVGMNNTSYSHFYTSATNGFYFDKPIFAKGGYRVYGTNTTLNDGQLVLSPNGSEGGEVVLQRGSGESVGNATIDTASNRVRIHWDGSEKFSVDNTYLRLGNKNAIKFSDSWLRLNDSNAFSSGIYTGSSLVRSDHALQVGSNGSTFLASSTALTYKGNKVFHAGNDGSGSGLDADKLDNLNSSQFIRSDINDDVTAHTEWQDSKEARFGASADLRILHNGTNSHIDNYTNDLYLRNLAHGREIYLQAEGSSGTKYTGMAVIADGSNNVYSQLYYNGVSKVYTRSDGARTNGTHYLTAWQTSAMRAAQSGNTFLMRPYDDGAWQTSREFGYDDGNNRWFVETDLRVNGNLSVGGNVTASDVTAGGTSMSALKTTVDSLSGGSSDGGVMHAIPEGVYRPHRIYDNLTNMGLPCGAWTDLIDITGAGILIDLQGPSLRV